MTGNTVLLGIALGRLRGISALHSSLALIGFVAGVAIGTVVKRPERKVTTWPSVVTTLLGIECLILVAFAIIGFKPVSTISETHAISVLILLASIAMGLQSAITRRLDVSGITTTYITGTLTSLVTQLTHRLLSVREVGKDQLIRNTVSPHQTWLLAGVWIAYGIAAALTAVIESQNVNVAYLMPALLLGAALPIALLAQRRS